MDVTGILLIVGGIVLVVALIWAAVAIIGFRMVRNAQKEMFTDFNKGFESDFFKRN